MLLPAPPRCPGAPAPPVANKNRVFAAHCELDAPVGALLEGEAKATGVPPAAAATTSGGTPVSASKRRRTRRSAMSSHKMSSADRFRPSAPSSTEAPSTPAGGRRSSPRCRFASWCSSSPCWCALLTGWASPGSSTRLRLPPGVGRETAADTTGVSAPPAGAFVEASNSRRGTTSSGAGAARGDRSALNRKALAPVARPLSPFMVTSGVSAHCPAWRRPASVQQRPGGSAK